MLQRILFSRALPSLVLAFALLAAGSAYGQIGDVRINEVQPPSSSGDDGWVELFNTGDTAVDVSSYFLCSFPNYLQINTLSDEQGGTISDFTIEPGGFLVVAWEETSNGNDTFTETQGEVGLYENNNDFSNPDNILAYVLYGNADAGVRDGVADDAGIWTEGVATDAPPSGATLAFLGSDPESADDWGAGNPTPGSANSVIPVELTAFDGAVDGRHVHLTWRTASETNNAGFEVQHRSGTAAFQRIDFVEGHGTTDVPQTYRFTVRDLSPGTHTFRLKQLDFDGTFEFSPTIEVVTSLAEAYALTSVAPNPTPNSARLSLTVREAQSVRVGVYDALGRRMATLYDGELSSGRTENFVFDGSRFSAGLYLIRVTGERFSETRRLTLVR